MVALIAGDAERLCAGPGELLEGHVVVGEPVADHFLADCRDLRGGHAEVVLERVIQQRPVALLPLLGGSLGELVEVAEEGAQVRVHGLTLVGA